MPVHGARGQVESVTGVLPDPRRFAQGAESALLQAAEESAALEAATGQRSIQQLAENIAAMLDGGEEHSLREALRHPSSSRAAQALQRALDVALAPPVAKDGVNLQVFAMPVVIVVGAQTSQRVAGVLSEPDAIRLLFERSGALGHCRNFGISNALSSMDCIEAIAWTTLRSIAAAQSWDEFQALDLPPADIEVSAGRESVHLRFTCGAALTPADAPAFVEAAGNVGRWGIELAKELGKQLATPDVQLLAIPRAPRSIIRAVTEGWIAAREVGFQLFLSNAVRQARMRVGEPDVTVSAASDQTIRIQLTSPFDDLFNQTYSWSLTPCDELGQIEQSILQLLDEARLERITMMPTVDDEERPDRSTH